MVFLILLLIYTLVQILHEFGHPFTVEKWGNEIHEMGSILHAYSGHLK